MAEIWVMGEMLVEIMRTEPDSGLDVPGTFRGPYPSGAPAIFIDTAARLGHKTGIIGGVGDDDFGKCLMDRLESHGVDISQVVKNKTVSTGCAFVTYFSDGSRKFIYHLGNTPAVQAKAPDKSVLKGVKFFHVMGCSLFSDLAFAKEILKAVKTAKELGAKISFDPNIRPELMGSAETAAIVEEIMRLTNILMPGEEELLLLTGKESVQSAVAVCFENPELSALTLKQGSRGCTAYTRTGIVRQGVYKVSPVDATGAGDSFDGAFISSLLSGFTIDKAVRYASAAGALNTAAFGPMEGDISERSIVEMIQNGD